MSGRPSRHASRRAFGNGWRRSAFVSHALGDNPGKAFKIVGGELAVNKDAKRDFETAADYEISIIATDKDGATIEESFTINLTDVAEDPWGTKHDDVLFGDAMDNTIKGRRDSDKLAGGDGADTFVFGRNFGKDVIQDFDPADGDTIDLSRAVGIESFGDLRAAHSEQVGNHLVIRADDGSVVKIKNADLDALTADIFVF